MSNVEKKETRDEIAAAGDGAAGNVGDAADSVKAFEQQLRRMQEGLRKPAAMLSSQLGPNAFAETFKGVRIFNIRSILVHASGAADIIKAVEEQQSEKGLLSFAKKIEGDKLLLTGKDIQDFISQGRKEDENETAYMVFPSRKVAVKALEAIQPLLPEEEGEKKQPLAVCNFEGQSQAYIEVPFDVVHQLNVQLINLGKPQMPIEDVQSLEHMKRELAKPSKGQPTP